MFASLSAGQLVAWSAVGNASEIAMIKFCQPFRDVDEYRAANPNVFKIPFNSKNKYQVRMCVRVFLWSDKSTCVK